MIHIYLCDDEEAVLHQIQTALEWKIFMENYDMKVVCAAGCAQALLEAVESGRISMSRLDDSVRRILALKRNEAYAVNDEAVAEPDLEGLNTLIKESLTPAS